MKISSRNPVLVKASMVSQSFVLKNRLGLHCRPAALLVKNLEHFGCKVMVESNGTVANGRSIFGLLYLAAGYNAKLAFVLTGSDVEEAIKMIQRLFESDFAEAYRDHDTGDNSQMKSGEISRAYFGNQFRTPSTLLIAVASQT